MTQLKCDTKIQVGDTKPHKTVCDKGDQSCNTSQRFSKRKILVNLTSGAIAGAIAKSTIAPLDRTKIYFQTHTGAHYSLKGAFNHLWSTYTNNGFSSLWRGNSATMARVVPHAGVQFMAHDQYKHLLGISKPSNKDFDAQKSGVKSSHRNVLHFIAGSLAGVTGQTIVYPLDRARAVMAVTNTVQYKNLFDTFRIIIREEGYMALYRGFFPTIVGVIPYAGVSFLTYEKLKESWLQKESWNGANSLTDSQPKFSPLCRLLFGGIAGALGQTVAYPLDTVRRRMQTARQIGIKGNGYTTIVSSLMYILRTEGVRRGWYKGITMNFIKGPIASGISLTANDYCKMTHQRLNVSEKPIRSTKQNKFQIDIKFEFI